MTGRTKGGVRLEKVQVGLPEGVYDQIERIVTTAGEWMSVADFLREAAKEKLDRWKSAGHKLPEGQSPAEIAESVRAREVTARRRAP